MTPIRRKWATLALLTCYLLGMTVGERFHDPPGRGRSQASSRTDRCRGSHHCDSCGEKPAVGRRHRRPVWVSADGGRQGSRARPHGPCPVCKFLGQKPIPPRPVYEVTSTPLERRLPVLKRICRTEDRPSAYASRAPPPIA